MKYTRSLLRKVNKAIDEFQLINDGDRVCVSLSGGKDSLSLLYLLIEHKRFFPKKYSIEAVHVVSDFVPNDGEIKEYLKVTCNSWGVPCGFTEISIMTGENGMRSEPSCFWCSWNRREALFKYCVAHNINKLALGHHFDDVAETALLNIVFHAKAETMYPCRSFFDGKFDLIRPLFYLRERETVRLAKMAGFLTKTCTCKHAENGKRQLMKDTIRNLSKESRYLHHNLWRVSRKWLEAFGTKPLHPELRKDEYK